jgi:hypothetical protein
MPAIITDEFGRHIASDFAACSVSLTMTRPTRRCRADRAGKLGLERCLYHNVEHTFLVTLVGRTIIHGRMLA